jgi:hypothetical protein
MKLAGLKEYLALSEARKGDVDGDELVNKWMDREKAHSFEGSTGVRNLEKLVKTLGYRDINDFLMDNSGAIEAVIEFITKWVDRNDDWAEALQPEIDLDYNEVARKISALGVKASARVVAAFLEGGDAPGFKEFMDEIETELGYDSSATTYDENAKFWKEIGVSKEAYDRLAEVFS